jgi:hypothetical protein
MSSYVAADRATRALLLAVMLVTLAGGCGSDGESADGAPVDALAGDGAVSPSDSGWSIDTEALPAALYRVWQDEDGTLWSVGDDPGDGSGPLLLRRSAAADGWTPEDLAAFSGALWWMHGVGSGEDAQQVAVGAAGRVLWRQGAGDWVDVPSPAAASDKVLYGVWMSGPGHFWAVGGNAMAGTSVLLEGVDLPGGGVTLTVAQTPPLPAGAVLFKVWGASADNVAAVGTEGALLRFDGAAWHVIDTAGTALEGARMLTVHGGMTDGGGALEVAVGGVPNGEVYERASDGPWMTVGPEALQMLNGVRVASVAGALRGVAVGMRGTLVERDAAGGWTWIDDSPTQLDLHGATIDAAGRAWAVGGNLFAKPPSDGVILVREPWEAP